MFIFETLNFVPIDKNLIDISLMTNEEKDWLNEYHLKCRKKIRENLEENEKNLVGPRNKKNRIIKIFNALLPRLQQH